jgi:hypothetical protein
MTDFQIEFKSYNRKAQVAPNPLFPRGMAVDLTNGAAVACLATLPYPAECCGMMFVVCKKCGANAALTVAGRPDDPRSVKLPCKADW